MDEAAEAMLTAPDMNGTRFQTMRSRACLPSQSALLDGGDYLGLGPSAQSFVNGVRFGNVPT